jgi:hypothetical protein
MPSVALYNRNGIVLVVPMCGMVDVDPVSRATMNAGDIAAAIRSAIAAIPSVMPVSRSIDRSPVLDALGLKSAIAFERGLKSAVLRFNEDKYCFYRYVPHAMFKTGFRREDDPLFTVERSVALAAVAEKILAALNDPTWPVKYARKTGGAPHPKA